MLKIQPNILVIGALGQVGSELTSTLRDLYGVDNVIASDITKAGLHVLEGPFECLDCTDAAGLFEIVSKHKINVIYHLAALLSATAEAKPKAAWHLNVTGLQTVLEIARVTNCQVFVPSSIAAFGITTPPDKTPQLTIQRPNTIYGISKVTAELLCDYYVQRYNLDIRGLRYPGLISTDAPPGGGTTDYAIDLLRAAATGATYTSPLKANTFLDMMYMPDAIQATLKLMHTDPAKLKHSNAYNITAFSLSPAKLAETVRQYKPKFKLRTLVNPQLQAIADSWPNSLDDSAAQQDWGWQASFDIEAMTKDALTTFATQDNLAA